MRHQNCMHKSKSEICKFYGARTAEVTYKELLFTFKILFSEAGRRGSFNFFFFLLYSLKVYFSFFLPIASLFLLKVHLSQTTLGLPT